MPRNSDKSQSHTATGKTSHSAASELLRAGGSLAEVGQVLRHQESATTSLYAKVDRRALGAVVRPWPGEAR